MLKSLRARLSLAFAVVILTTVVLGGIVSVFITRTRFDILVTDQGRTQAERIAPLLADAFNAQQDWDSLLDIFRDSAESIEEELTQIELEESAEWQSGVDWDEVIFTQLEMSRKEFEEVVVTFESINDYLRFLNSDISAISEAVFMAEEVAVIEAVSAENLSAEGAEQLIGILPTEIEKYLNNSWVEKKPTHADAGSPLNWQFVAATELGLSQEAFNKETETKSLASIAEERGADVQNVANAIITAQIEFNEGIIQFEDVSEEIYYLAGLRDAVDNFMLKFPVPESGIEANSSQTNNTQTALINMLLGEDRIIVANKNDVVVYDRDDDQMLFETLSASRLEEGVAILDNENEKLGTVIVATGQGVYDAQQQAVLQNLTISLLISGLIAALVGVIVSWIMARRVLAPVKGITNAAVALVEGKSTSRLPIESDDELGAMSKAFNKLADAIETEKMLRNRLISDVSHELNTPLSVIQLEMEALNDGMQTSDDAVGHVQEEIDLLRGLVNDLNLVAEEEKGEYALEVEPIALDEFTKRGVSRWQSKAEVREIALTVSTAGRMPKINADPMRLSQVLGNLINNAIQHTPPNGHIHVEVEARRLHSLPGLWIVTTVNDTGRGIAPDAVNHVFERFYRTDYARHRRKGGRGLGLAIVKQIVSQHQGLVWVKSELGKGSSFSYALPLKPISNSQQLSPRKKAI